MGMMGKVLPIRLDLAQPNFRKFRDVTKLTVNSQSHPPVHRNGKLSTLVITIIFSYHSKIL